MRGRLVSCSSQLIRFQVREYGEGINKLLIHARYLMNSFHVTVRIPPEILNMVCSYLTTEDDAFSASQVCHHWRGVLTSSPPLWTRHPCHHVSRTIASLERCKFMPIQLEFDQRSSNAALESLILSENKVSSLAIHHGFDGMQSLPRLLSVFGPSVERLHIYSNNLRGWRDEDQTAHEIWQDLPSLRELFVCRYSIPINQLTAPNLTHLALEQAAYHQNVTVQLILDMLRGYPLLETLLITGSGVRQNPTRDHSPVPLPHLRSIELGAYEVCSGLTTYLQFPPNAAAGFRMLPLSDVCGDIPLEIMAAMQHVLRMVDIHTITLAVPPYSRGDVELLVRFDGLQGSLEMTIRGANTHTQLWDVFFGPRGALFSHSPRIENVRELHIVYCPFEDGRGMDHINAAMSNLVSISFSYCEGPHLFGLLAPTNPLSPPFPHLKRVMSLGPESELRGMAKARRDHGVPLKTLVVGRPPRGIKHDLGGPTAPEEFEYDRLEDYTVLEEFVEDLCVGCPTEILEWGTGNDILDVWSTAGIPGPVSPNVRLVLPG